MRWLRPHTDGPMLPAVGVLVLVCALMMSGPLGNWTHLAGYLTVGAPVTCPHHHDGAHVCPHHAAMAAVQANDDMPPMPDGAVYCPDHPPEQTEALSEEEHQIRCTCDHDGEGPDSAVIVLDKFVLTALAERTRALYTYALYRTSNTLGPTVWADDIFHPPRG